MRDGESKTVNDCCHCSCRSSVRALCSQAKATSDLLTAPICDNAPGNKSDQHENDSDPDDYHGKRETGVSESARAVSLHVSQDRTGKELPDATNVCNEPTMAMPFQFPSSQSSMQDEVLNVARALGATVHLARTGNLELPSKGLTEPIRNSRQIVRPDAGCRLIDCLTFQELRRMT